MAGVGDVDGFACACAGAGDAVGEGEADFLFEGLLVAFFAEGDMKVEVAFRGIVEEEGACFGRGDLFALFHDGFEEQIEIGDGGDEAMYAVEGVNDAAHLSGGHVDEPGDAVFGFCRHCVPFPRRYRLSRASITW